MGLKREPATGFHQKVSEELTPSRHSGAAKSMGGESTPSVSGFSSVQSLSRVRLFVTA